MYVRHIEGDFGELCAVKFLVQNGYNIIERNFSCRQGEIDIIAKDGNELVFVEVKTRSSFMFGDPIDAIDKNKKKHMCNAARYFLYVNGLEGCFVRFDAIGVLVTNKGVKLKHLKQIM